ncbi:MAG: hypothetical protein ACP5UH_03530 [Candidatus Micrarchaeia archaeon]
MLEDGLKSRSISTLIGQLHAAILSVTKAARGITKKNDALSIHDIRELRDHITKRLEAKEDIGDNEKLLMLLNLFATDKEVLELVRDETEEWARLLQAIEESLIKKQEGLTKEEKLELEEVIKLTRDIKEMVRSG